VHYNKENHDPIALGFKTGLYPISSNPYSDKLGHLRLAEEFLRAGASILQIREKRLSDTDLAPIIRKILMRCRSVGATLIINDRVDLVRKSGADGIHLGQSDISPVEARDYLGDTVIIGLSTHNEDQFLAAQDSPIDYVSLGPIFRTSTKSDSSPEVGIALLRRLAPISRIPIVAIGGLRLSHAAEVWKSGAAAIAVISDVCKEPEQYQRVRSYLTQREKFNAFS